MPHVWADEAPPPALRVRAYMYSGSDGPCWGELAVAPPLLTWTPDAGTATAAMGACGLVEGQPALARRLCAALWVWMTIRTSTSAMSCVCCRARATTEEPRLILGHG